MFVLISGQKRIYPRVKEEEGMVTISPGKGLGHNVEMGVCNELGSLKPSMVVRLQENVEHTHSHTTPRHEVGEEFKQASSGPWLWMPFFSRAAQPWARPA